MSLLVVGSIAFDSIKTPFGEVREELGGSATYFSVAASFFTNVNLVAVVGEDFPKEHLDAFTGHGINLDGLERSLGKTFRWQGEYGNALDDAKTLKTELNVLESFRPKLPRSYSNIPHIFLANIEPGLQQDVLRQVATPRLTACDTMNFWIEGCRDRLLKTLEKVDMTLINEGEARLLSGERNLVLAAKKILSWGPKTLVIKRGGYGALMFYGQKIFSVPAYPLELVVDPTGAGDSFAGGFMGYLAKQGEVTETTLRQAAVYGSVVASFCVEDFGLRRMWKLTAGDIKDRYTSFYDLTTYEHAV